MFEIETSFSQRVLKQRNGLGTHAMQGGQLRLVDVFQVIERRQTCRKQCTQRRLRNTAREVRLNRIRLLIRSKPSSRIRRQRTIALGRDRLHFANDFW